MRSISICNVRRIHITILGRKASNGCRVEKCVVSAPVTAGARTDGTHGRGQCFRRSAVRMRRVAAGFLAADSVLSRQHHKLDQELQMIRPPPGGQVFDGARTMRHHQGAEDLRLLHTEHTSCLPPVDVHLSVEPGPTAAPVIADVTGPLLVK